jgi:hypothetical protein
VTPQQAQSRVLRRHFFREMVHNDLLSPRGDTEIGLIQLLATLCIPGVFFSHAAALRYLVRLRHQPVAAREAAVLGDQALIMGFSMLVIAFVTVLAWDSLLLGRRDFSALTPLPISRRALLAAKARAVLAFVSLFAAAANLLPLIVFPMVSGGVEEGLPSTLWRATCHSIAVASGALCVALGAIGARGALAHAFAGRLARFSRAAQVALLLLIVQAAFLLPAFARAMRDAGSSLPVLLVPAAWFVGLYQLLLGNAQKPHAWLALAGLAALAISALAALLSYSPALGEPHAEARPSGGRRLRGGRLRRLFEAVALRQPGERAIFWFCIATVLRSQQQRVYLGAFCAVGIALSGVVAMLASFASAGSPADLERALLRASLLLTLFVVVGVRFVFGLPAELPANWVFRLGEATDSGPRLAGARKAALVLALAPTLGALMPLAALSHWSVPLIHAVYGCVVATLLVEALSFGLARLPFACAYAPGGANLRSFWAAYLGAFLLFATLVPGLESWLLGHPAGLVPLSAAAAAVVVARRVHQAFAPARGELVRDDMAATDALRLDLSS